MYTFFRADPALLLLALCFFVRFAHPARAVEQVLEESETENEETQSAETEATDREDAATDDVQDYADVDLEKLLSTVSTASKHEQDIAESPSAITVITREEIENSACSNVTCLLRGVPEIEVKRYTAMYAVVGARALNSDPGDKILVLVDGREINLDSFGFVLWETLPIHLEEIERIEIIRGPGSALYGANALSAVISIVTRRAERNIIRGFLEGGEQGIYGFHLGWDQLLGDWRLQLSGGRESSGNWQVADQVDREVTRFRIRAEREKKSSLTSIDFGLNTPNGTVHFLVVPLYIHDSINAYLTALHQNEYVRAKLSLTLYDFYYDIDMPLVFHGDMLGRIPQNTNLFSSTLDGEVQANWRPFSGNLLIAGGNYRWITFMCQNNEPESIHQHRLGFFIHDEQRLGQAWTLTAGVRLDYNSLTPITVSPRLAAVWRATEDQSLRLAFGQAFRKPSFMNTSYHIAHVQGDQSIREFFVKSIGNDQLDNERINAFELGYLGRFLNRRAIVEADLFFNQYRKTLALVTNIKINSLGMPDLGQSIMQYQNNGMDVNSLGGSISLTYRVVSELYLSVNYTYRFSWYVSTPFSVSDETGDKAGDRLSWEPAHLFNFSGYYISNLGLRFGAGLHADSSRINLINNSGSVFDAFENSLVPADLFFSAFVAWRFKRLHDWVEVGLRASNAFNQPFHEAAGQISNTGVGIGGAEIGRQAMLYCRGSME